MKKVAERVSLAIEESTLSDSDIASKVGVSSTTVWRWRTGKKKSFTDRDLTALAEALKMNYDWLRFGRGGKFENDKLNQIESAVADEGGDYKGLDQTLSDVESKARSLVRDLQSLLDDLEKVKRGD